MDPASFDERYRKFLPKIQQFRLMDDTFMSLVFQNKACTEFLIHAVDVEGKQSGIDRELLHLLAESSPIDCVYAGGISSLEEIADIDALGRGKIHYTIGSALDLFGGKLKYDEIIRL